MSDTTLSDEDVAAQRRKDEYDAKMAAADSEIKAAADEPTGDAAPAAEPTADAAPAGDAEAKAPAKVKSGADRRPRGWLETDVKRITDAFIQGQVTLENGQFLTPHRLSKLVKELDSLDEAPSTGACAAVLVRWKENGFAELHEAPLAFKDYTPEGRSLGLTALKEKRKADRKASREAEKAATKAAEAAAAPATPAPAPAPETPAASTADGPPSV